VDGGKLAGRLAGGWRRERAGSAPEGSRAGKGLRASLLELTLETGAVQG